MITFDDFKKVEITVGKILSAEKVPETDKLLRLMVDFGDKIPPLPQENNQAPMTNNQTGRDTRQIVSGISAYFPDPQVLVGKKCMFVTNLEPRTIKGLESNGMLFAVSTEDLPAPGGARQAGGKFSLLEPNAEIPEGTRAR
jgi:tRNA-binding EMAP/Myf-like protein